MATQEQINEWLKKYEPEVVKEYRKKLQDEKNKNNQNNKVPDMS